MIETHVLYIYTSGR